MRSLRASAALATTTQRDLLRRPGALLAWAAVAVLLLMLPRLARRALDDGGALAVELALSTTWLYGALFGGLAAAGAASPSSPLGPAPELLVTPLQRSGYLLGRTAGLVSAAWVHAFGLLAVGALAVAITGEALPGAPLAAAAVAGAVQVLFFVALGIAAGATLGPQLGPIAVIAFLIASRVLVPGLTASGSTVALFLPDPARLDISREVAFGRPLGAAALLYALAATAAQAAGLLVIAHLALGRERLVTNASAA